jgi:drug/metabolite transporter (DMT)-like permease
MTIQIGILLALLCAFVTNLAFFYKHRGACEVPAICLLHPLRSARSLLGSRWFALGLLIAVGAWILHVAAMALAPLSVVQVVLAGGVVLIGVMAERLFGFKVRPRQWVGVGLTAAGLLLLGVTLPVTGGAHSSFSLSGMIAFEAVLIVLGALLIMGPRIGARDEHHGVMLGAAAGILFGVSDISIKALTGLVGSSGVVGILSPWLVVTIAASVVAFYASARGLQQGEAVPVIAVTGSAANVACIAGGIVVFGDPMPGNALGIVAQLVAFIMVCVAATLTPAPVRAAGAAPAPAAA